LPLARSGLLPDAVTAVLARYGDARVRIVDGPYDELLHGLLDGSIDLIVGALRDPLPAGHLLQKALFDDALSIVVRAGHPALQHETLSAGVYSELDWIVPRKGTPARGHFEKYFLDRGIAVPLRVVECSSLIATRALLLQSDRAAILSSRQVALELDYGILVDLSGPLPGTRRQIGIAMRDGWHPTALQKTLIDELISRSAMVEISTPAAVESVST
jgi:DNA-binding transcriptional LysR family regulator